VEQVTLQHQQLQEQLAQYQQQLANL
jgi:hypothetical protein